jgi:hypothetical protein
MNRLALVTSDRDLLAVLGDICEVPIIRFGTVESAVNYAVSRLGWPLVAIGPDVVTSFTGPIPQINYTILHTGKFDTGPLIARQAPMIWELPGELDWMNERLGVKADAMAELDDLLGDWA